MELRLHKERYERMICAANRTMEDAFTADVVVPDAMPDVASVLLTDGDFCLWRLDFSDGCAEAEGEWKGSVCYQEESGLVKSFPVSVGIRMRISDDAIRPELRPFAAFRVSEVGAQVMNSRKLRIKVRISLRLQCYAMDELELTTGFENPGKDVFGRQEELCFSSVVNVQEQLFTVGGSHEIGLTPGGTLLSAHSEIIAEKPQIAALRAVLQGVIQTDLLYLPEGEKLPMTERIQTPFSQLLDVAQLDPEDTFQLQLQLTSAELTPQSEKGIEAEFHVVAQALQIRSVQAPVLKDAYSLSGALISERSRGEIQQFSFPETQEISLSCDTEAEADDSGMIAVVPYLHSLQVHRESMQGVVSFHILVQQENGLLRSARLTAPFEYQTAYEYTPRRIWISAAEARVRNGAISANAKVMLDLTEANSVNADQVTSVRLEETSTTERDAASLVLVPRIGNDDLWELAKQYRSTVEMIEKTNQADEDAEARYLLIPAIPVN